jgi:hypothetical protein
MSLTSNKTWANSPSQEGKTPGNLLQIVESTALNVEESSGRTAQVHAFVLSKSQYIDNPKASRQNNLTNFVLSGIRRLCRMQPPLKGFSLGTSLWLR